jgi:hypothetical protein
LGFLDDPSFTGHARLELCGSWLYAVSISASRLVRVEAPGVGAATDCQDEDGDRQKDSISHSPSGRRDHEAGELHKGIADT